jgi:sugar lactone lactonase YvrE
MDIECVLEANAMLGEGALWDPREQVLWWVDIKAREIHCFDPTTGSDRIWSTPEDIGCLAVREQGGLVVALRSGFHFFDPQSDGFSAIADPEAECAENRFNDGKPDRQGRFWAGTMYEGPNPKPSAALYRLDADLTCHRMITGITCSNGLAWSPDGRVMYYADSLAQRVWAWDFDPGTGEIENRRLFIDTAPLHSNPDGATVDHDGRYWLTLPEADKLGCFDPDGTMAQLIDMPAHHPTCAAFGGRDLDVLYITTATMFRTPAELAIRPLTGGLFALNVGAKGLPEAPFRG